ncbi:efflux RND transporter permease subunit [Aeromonas salmonicida subsp. achromogenes]|uniref:efflux RND transporter permease subunit n=1 Tax=Aeromonas salmonicida TaxID=645 RepID=UPI0002EC87C4|nr:efflux RND transporter permease subunit [Aeromonas salmonicida]TMX08135.1 efflux RND transporter permease subunit [Aeromonas salmonicida subsp. achromogenes]TMX09662.1 efflux RND transporter permease subunit [Aeromonas salmonicida subsp. achromogenes]TMX10295.1 efflux RND transporter permease subunit [Aeromonas salmonicida subsp. achromogenes]TMX18069.1 efflux RND transporter permease subunit [Aeromonas salmonicida subsp. achromogenes]
MNLAKTAIERPIWVVVSIVLIFLLGLLSIRGLPIQLFPDIDRPHLNISVDWRSASPQEMESEITDPIEQEMQGVQGLKSLTSNSFPGFTEIDLEFALGTDMQRAQLDVISRLNRVSGLPDNIGGPYVNNYSSNDTLTFFFIQQLPGVKGQIDDHQALIEARVKPELERIPGVSTVEVEGINERQIQIRFDPYRAAELGVEIPVLASRASTGWDVSAGTLDIGRWEYKLRFAGRYDVDTLGDKVVDWRDGLPIYLRDVAEIRLSREENPVLRIQNGNTAIAAQIFKESGANALAALEAIKVKVSDLNRDVLEPVGLHMEQSFDASLYINRAVGMVTANLGLGVLLSCAILWLFLRQLKATLMIALAIPISIMLTFCLLKVLGRTLNVISLAGIAFAVGMVLDAAIVVLESIYRRHERGDLSKAEAALVASTLTTVAIFLPVLLLNDVEGQLFADLALTIACAVTVSMLVAVTVLPAVAARWMGRERLVDPYDSLWQRTTRHVIRWTGTAPRRWSIIILMMSLPALATWALLPKMDYLPDVKRDAVDVWMSFTPGFNLKAQREEVIDTLIARLAPYMKGEKEPVLKNYYIMRYPGGAQIGVRPKDENRIKELENLLMKQLLVGIPDTQTFGGQGSLFGGFDSENGISLLLQGGNLPELYQAARESMAIVKRDLPGAQVRPEPDLDFTAPELRLVPQDRRLAEVGWDRTPMPAIIQTFGDGLRVGEYFDGEERLDIMLMGQTSANPDELKAVPLATPSGRIVPLGELLRVEHDMGPASILRVDGRRSISLQITPPEGMSMEQVLDTLQGKSFAAIRPLLPVGGELRIAGNADSLQQALDNLGAIFLFAVVILLILLWGVFASLKDAVLVLLTLPLASVGGVLALHLSGLLVPLPMDLLTIIGFVILLGLVVNNAILLVHQTRSAERDGMSRQCAVADALRSRMRPIAMTSLTSIFGMLPLMLSPSEGSEIYRGLATVIVGGMSCSTLFTLILLPAFLRLGEQTEQPPLALRQRA